MIKPVTLKEIAERVGVGTSAVSAVLRDKPSKHVRVSEETRLRILSVAQELKYRPNRAAQSLKSQTTNVYGIYAPPGFLVPDSPFALQVIIGLHRSTQRHRKNLMLLGHEVGQSAEELCGRLTNGQIDGCIVLAERVDPVIPLLLNSALPVIAIANRVEQFPSIVADDFTGGQLLIDYLTKRGHVRIGYYGSRGTYDSAQRRYLGSKATMERLGLDFVLDYKGVGDDDVENVWSAWKSMRSADRPTVIVCWNDIEAYAMLERGRALGIDVPTEVAVTGFDGISMAYPAPWRLTTVKAPWMEIAELGVDLLAQRIAGKDIPHDTFMPVELIAGDTA